MKKIYIFLLGLFALLGSSNSAQAKIIVTDTTTWISDLSTIQEGDALMLYCYGESSRRAFLYEQFTSDVQKPSLSRNFVLGDIDSRSYVWTAVSYNYVEDGDNSYAEVMLQSPSGKYMTGFTIDESSQWNYWNSDNMLVDSQDEAVTFTITSVMADFGSDADYGSVAPYGFYITDPLTNGRFNGQNDLDGDGISGFVGWGSGGNCIYLIKKATLEERTTTTVTLECVDQNENQIEESGTIDKEYLPGDSLYAPEYEHYSFKVAYDEEENEVTLPLVVGEEDCYYRLVYEQWPQITFIMEDEDGNILATSDNYYEVGTMFEAPTASEVTLGYELITTEYEGHIYTVDDDQSTFTLVYRKNVTAGLPFEPTTVENGEFASSTKYYKMTIRDAAGTICMEDVATGKEVDINISSIDNDSIDYAAWAFTGDLDNGFTIYNKGLGATYKMYASSSTDGTYLTMGTDEDIAALDDPSTASSTFKLIANGTGYTFQMIDADGTALNACPNQYGGSSNTALRFWTDDASLTDAGSRIAFTELTAEDIANALLVTPKSYLRTEGTVGGFTTEQLATLKAAVEANDRTAYTNAVAELKASTDTIAFDASKTYQLISAYTGFITSQPDATYAIYATADDSVRWGALEDTEAYQWIFTAASDTSYYVSNLAQGKSVASWRWVSGGNAAGGQAILGATATEESTDGDDIPAGSKAAFSLVKSTVAPAAYRLVHNYGSSIISMCILQGTGGDELTGGTIHTYNGDSADRGNAWRLKAVGGVSSSISSATVVPAGEQSNTIYDLSGRRVNNAQKGIYIINGQKVLVK